MYRNFATLYFIFVVDSSESDLGILDLIHAFVEALDGCFENVSELDIIFHADRVHFILDEMIMGGLVLEINQQVVAEAIREQNAIEKQEGADLGGSTGTKVKSFINKIRKK